MPPTIEYLNAHEIQTRRTELLRRAGLELATLKERAAQYRLSPEQSAILDELEDLEFLAGE